ncbi:MULTISPECIES: PEPxxWA-CTERM sorting domain-containing protein [unclassified Sphingomonas]|uniref:PEPxxWA-CTERM sorting domain-containing protein n=1 Tax=unclassified Sphingomonas TaxID=196159 RepID=UPI0025CC64E8|nr:MULTISPECIES: PEPxxWA-CTERM sorting domain-containing protein [unclassified Sphingomonas]
MRGLFAAAVIAASVAAAPAISAAPVVVTSGSFASGDSIGQVGSYGVGPGRYRFTFATDAPVDLFVGEVINTRTTNIFCNEGSGPFYCGGDDVPLMPSLDPAGPGRWAALIEVMPFTITPGGGFIDRYETSDSCCGYDFAFEALGAGSYVLSVEGVPEPASWALMLAGFAATGAALRMRRRPGPALA